MSVDDSAFDGYLMPVECMYAEGMASTVFLQLNS